MEYILNQLIDDFHERSLPDLMARQQSMLWVPGKANVIIGMRRSGKTWFCYQQMQGLLEQGIDRKRLLYINFEDERLLPFAAADFQTILETYYRKFPSLKHEQCYIFLDEVQRIEGWDKFVRRALDTENLNICLTGSSSRLLSTEIATSLRGRSITTEIFPFSFKEFLRFNKVDVGPTPRFGSAKKALIQNMVGKYLKIGGFPEVQFMDDELRRQILRNYLDVVILRDVVERHSISNVSALRSLIRHIMSAPATRFSVNKFYHSLRSRGISCTKNNLYDFLEHLKDSFLFYQAPIYSRSEKVKQVNPRKTYVIDSGIQEAMSLPMTHDHGALLENMIFMHLRREGFGPEYYVTKNGNEVDFILLPETGDEPQLIQVCWDIENRDTFRRETRALLAAMDELGLKHGLVVTWMHEGSTDERLEIVPAWKWMLKSTS